MSTSKQIAAVPGALKAKLPAFIEPQLATPVKEPPSGDPKLCDSDVTRKAPRKLRLALTTFIF